MDLRDLERFRVWEADNPPADWWLVQIAGVLGIKLARKATPEEEAAAWEGYFERLRGGRA